MTSHSLYSLLSSARDCGITNLLSLQALVLLEASPSSIPALAEHLGIHSSAMLTEGIDLIGCDLAGWSTNGKIHITEAGRDHLAAILLENPES